MRKLASIQRIVDIQAIPEADKIDCVTVLGWKCIVKKGEFKVGDLVIYIEPDSMLPFNPWTGEESFDKPMRLKTVKMKKQISQGLVLSTNLPQLTGSIWLQEGTDITEQLGITKYEPPPLPAQLSGIAKGNFPSFLVKTDEERIQSCPGILDRYKGVEFLVTEKLDGCSVSYYLIGDVFGVCSRNLELKENPEVVQWKIAEELKIKEALAAINEKKGGSFAVQGELVGPKIQDNKLAFPNNRFYAFNLYDIANRRFLGHNDLTAWCLENNIPQVPLLCTITFGQGGHSTVDDLVNLVTCKSTFNPAIWMEGGVFRPAVEQHDPDLGRLSFKCINPEFLLKYKE